MTIHGSVKPQRVTAVDQAINRWSKCNLKKGRGEPYGLDMYHRATSTRFVLSPPDCYFSK